MDINMSQKILSGVVGSKSILRILAILRGVYGVIWPITGPIDLFQNLRIGPVLIRLCSL